MTEVSGVFDTAYDTPKAMALANVRTMPVDSAGRAQGIERSVTLSSAYSASSSSRHTSSPATLSTRMGQRTDAVALTPPSKMTGR